MKMFKRAVIIGTGLIGSSLGLALKKHHLAQKVIGLSRLPKNALLARKSGAIDSVASSLNVCSGADLVILAVPVDKINILASKIAKFIKKGCAVIDVGSTKEDIVLKAEALIPDFLGCHPLAGSEKRGAGNLRKDLFKDSICIITPTPGTGKALLKKISALWKRIGARPVILTAKEHDRILAYTSHLPHLTAFSLIRTIPEEYLAFGSSSLKDATRVSASDAALWRSIFMANRNNLLGALKSFRRELGILESILKRKDTKELKKILAAARIKREKLK
jgi:prephenate dehydrogenase